MKPSPSSVTMSSQPGRRRWRFRKCGCPNDLWGAMSLGSGRGKDDGQVKEDASGGENASYFVNFGAAGFDDLGWRVLLRGVSGRFEEGKPKGRTQISPLAVVMSPSIVHCERSCQTRSRRSEDVQTHLVNRNVETACFERKSRDVCF